MDLFVFFLGDDSASKADSVTEEMSKLRIKEDKDKSASGARDKKKEVREVLQ